MLSDKLIGGGGRNDDERFSLESFDDNQPKCVRNHVIMHKHDH